MSVRRSPFRSLCFGLNSFLLRCKRSQRIEPNAGIVKVNFGSFLLVAPGWINVDGSPDVFFAGWPTPALNCIYRLAGAKDRFGSEADYIRALKGHRFVHHNLEYGLPFPDESVDYIYASHVIEHFYSDVCDGVLRDAYRVLKKGGRIRVCVPDLDHALQLYALGQKERALQFFFSDSGAHLLSRHKYMYDFELLQAALRKAGFGLVQRAAYREGKVPDIEKLDNRPEETMYVEAVK